MNEEMVCKTSSHHTNTHPFPSHRCPGEHITRQTQTSLPQSPSATNRFSLLLTCHFLFQPSAMHASHASKSAIEDLPLTSANTTGKEAEEKEEKLRAKKKRDKGKAAMLHIDPCRKNDPCPCAVSVLWVCSRVFPIYSHPLHSTTLHKCACVTTFLFKKIPNFVEFTGHGMGIRCVDLHGSGSARAGMYVCMRLI
jgi:hypothetical protein